MPVFVRDVYYFVTGVTKAATQGRSESQLPEQSGFVQSFTKWFWGEMELCYDLMLWFTHTSSALLSNISHEVDAK